MNKWTPNKHKKCFLKMKPKNTNVKPSINEITEHYQHIEKKKMEKNSNKKCRKNKNQKPEARWTQMWIFIV